MADKVTVFEVGPRDGLQNEPRPVALNDKLRFIANLIRAGVRELEVGSFVRADRVPQMSDTDQVLVASRKAPLKALLSQSKARLWTLVPNLKGLERAEAAGVRHIALFTAATDGFALKNIGMTVSESLVEQAKVARAAHAAGMQVRGYVSTVFGCPFEGKVAPSKALRVIERVGEMGVSEVSIGDTIGVATPAGVDQIVPRALKSLGVERTALHFHDTRGTALANSLRAIELGVRTLDASAGGLGGCPFAPGATGNLATEDLVYMLEGMGMRTGIDLDRLCATSLELARAMKRPIASRYLQAFSASKR